MALPPLELFSLKKRPPCCRVASSLSGYNFRVRGVEKNGSKHRAKRRNVSDLRARWDVADANGFETDEMLRRKRYLLVLRPLLADGDRSFVSDNLDLAEAMERSTETTATKTIFP
jgi:hypothetical protein